LSSRNALAKDERIMMEISATVYFKRFDGEGDARGTLFLVDSERIVFVTRRLRFFGPFDRHHEYDKSQILNIDTYSDGFRTHVHFPETDDEPEEVITYFYGIDQDIDDWVAALSKETFSKFERPSVTSRQAHGLDWEGELPDAPEEPKKVEAEKTQADAELVTSRQRYGLGLKGKLPATKPPLARDILSPSMGERFCIKCGEGLPKYSRFCSSCGTKQPQS